MLEVKLGPRGTIVLPQELLKKMRLDGITQFMADVQNGKLVLVPMTSEKPREFTEEQIRSWIEADEKAVRDLVEEGKLKPEK